MKENIKEQEIKNKPLSSQLDSILTTGDDEDQETSELENDITCYEYRQFLEKLKIEFGEFLLYAQRGVTIRYSALKSRKKSIILRNLLKEFRNFSLANDKRVSKIMNKAKKKLNTP